LHCKLMLEYHCSLRGAYVDDSHVVCLVHDRAVQGTTSITQVREAIEKTLQKLSGVPQEFTKGCSLPLII
jgi:hypothetical protein